MNKVLVGVISDTHLTEIDDRIVNLYDRYLSHCDLVIHAGDIVNDEVLSIIKKPTYAVKGNMDVFSTLPIKRTIEILNKKIGIIHGYGAPSGIEERILKEFNDVHCIVYGHTHMPKSEIRDGVLLFNPGSPFDKRWAEKNSVGYLEITEESIKGIIKEL